jgi:hypothetical protein
LIFSKERIFVVFHPEIASYLQLHFLLHDFVRFFLLDPLAEPEEDEIDHQHYASHSEPVELVMRQHEVRVFTAILFNIVKYVALFRP